MHIPFADLDVQEPDRIASLIGFWLDEKAEEERQQKELEARTRAR